MQLPAAVGTKALKSHAWLSSEPINSKSQWCSTAFASGDIFSLGSKWRLNTEPEFDAQYLTKMPFKLNIHMN